MMKRLTFFQVVGKKQTYLNIVYIFFSFPLSLLFFILITTGVSLSLGLLVIFIGFLIFTGTLALIRNFRFIDIQMTDVFLGLKIPVGSITHREKGFSNWLKWLYSSGSTWKSFVYYSFIKLPLDIIIFSISLTFLAITLELLLAPLLMEQAWFKDQLIIPFLIDYLKDPYILPFMGIISIFISLHIINGLSWIYRMVNPVFLKA